MTLAEVKPDYDPHLEQRRDLAATFRWIARLNMHEGVANHFSMAVSDDGSQFLVNPANLHFSRAKASELILVDANDPTEVERGRIDLSAWCIHGAVHRNVPRARCILHVHSKYATAFACLKNPTLAPIDQNTMRYYNRYVVDPGFDGMGIGDEGERLSTLLQDLNVLVMGNHGVMVVGETVADAFDDLYYFERACETYITAVSTGLELNVVSDAVAEKTAWQWENYPDLRASHLREVRAILDEQEPDYAL